MKTIMHVVGARPNFMKVAPIHRAIAETGKLRQVIVHTGQHYDDKLSGVFVRELGLPNPDIDLFVGSGSHGEQTARVLVELERVLQQTHPDLVSVVGDVNSTLAAALATAKLGIKLSHVEAGLRSFDRTMPEEINRLVVDRLSDYLLTPSADGDDNLVLEGVSPKQIHRVGNVMIDTLRISLPIARALHLASRLGLPEKYAVCTIHRPGNVDHEDVLRRIIEALERVGKMLPIVLPAHPRTKARLEKIAFKSEKIKVLEPLGYLELLSLTNEAVLILTDSGGLQEEATALGVPCLTLRQNTERPVTVTEGTNTLVGTDLEKIVKESSRALAGQGKHGRMPALWDGHAGERIAALYHRIA